MDATYVPEEHHCSNSFERSLGALHFRRQPSLDVSVRKRILHVGAGVTVVEQEGQKVGRKIQQERSLDLESPLHGICEVMKDVNTQPFPRC
jgi:hypothetical protein